MTTLERYKKMYSKPNDSDNVLITDNKVTIPTWLAVYLLHSSGIKSKKKRIVNKTIKKQLSKVLKKYLNENRQA